MQALGWSPWSCVALYPLSESGQRRWSRQQGKRQTHEREASDACIHVDPDALHALLPQPSAGALSACVLWLTVRSQPALGRPYRVRLNHDVTAPSRLPGDASHALWAPWLAPDGGPVVAWARVVHGYRLRVWDMVHVGLQHAAAASAAEARMVSHVALDAALALSLAARGLVRRTCTLGVSTVREVWCEARIRAWCVHEPVPVPAAGALGDDTSSSTSASSSSSHNPHPHWRKPPLQQPWLRELDAWGWVGPAASGARAASTHVTSLPPRLLWLPRRHAAVPAPACDAFHARMATWLQRHWSPEEPLSVPSSLLVHVIPTQARHALAALHTAASQARVCVLAPEANDVPNATALLRCFHMVDRLPCRCVLALRPDALQAIVRDERRRGAGRGPTRASVLRQMLTHVNHATVAPSWVVVGFTASSAPGPTAAPRLSGSDSMPWLDHAHVGPDASSSSTATPRSFSSPSPSWNPSLLGDPFAPESVPKCSLDSLVGLTCAKEQLLAWARRRASGDASAARGVLLHGPPGCGKSALCNSLAGHVGARVLRLHVGHLVRGHIGASERLLSRAFRSVRRWAPCVMVLEAMDVAFSDRERSSVHHALLVTQLLAELDALPASVTVHEPSVLVLGTATVLANVDAAVLRSGRIANHIALGAADGDQCLALLRHQLEHVRMPVSPDLLPPTEAPAVPAVTEAAQCLYRAGCSAAAIKDVCNAAQRIALFENDSNPELCKSHLTQALTDAGYVASEAEAAASASFDALFKGAKWEFGT